jgi:hypothetical protein
MTTTLGTHRLGGAIRWQPAPGARSLQAVTAAPVADPGWPPVDPVFPPLMLTALNRFRAQNGARALVLDQRLLASSAYKARHMAQYLYMDHNDPDTPGHPAETFAQRITAFYGVNGAAENIAYGDYSRTATYDKTGHLLSVDLPALASSLVDAFASDVGHRANELSGSVAVGFAVAWSAPISGPDGVVDQLPFVVQDYGWDTHIVARQTRRRRTTRRPRPGMSGRRRTTRGRPRPARRPPSTSTPCSRSAACRR